MITVKTAPEFLDLVASTRSPSLYLDHWALREISSDEVASRRFALCIKSCGTLLFSWPNVIEISRNTGPSAERIKKFLGSVGDQWFPVEFNPFTVIEREQSSREGDNSPCLGDGFVRAYYPYIHGTTLSLASIVDLTRGEDFRSLALKKIDSLADQISGYFSEARRNRGLPHKVFEQKLLYDSRRPTSFVFPTLCQLLVKEDSNFERNDAIDLCHATVALSYGELVCLDPHWADLGKRLRLPEEQLRIFRPGQIFSFLEAFEQRQVFST